MLPSNVGGRRPGLVVVSGRPGSGKTTLARLLARGLDCPLVSRDEVTAGILRTVEGDPVLAGKDRVAGVAFEAFFGVIGLLVAAGATVVAEAAFQDQRWRLGLEPVVHAADLRLIHCVTGPDLARERVVRRRLEQRVPDLRPLTVRAFEPLSLPVPALRVDTTDGYEPPFEQVLAFAANVSTGLEGPPTRE